MKHLQEPSTVLGVWEPSVDKQGKVPLPCWASLSLALCLEQTGYSIRTFPYPEPQSPSPIMLTFGSSFVPHDKGLKPALILSSAVPPNKAPSSYASCPSLPTSIMPPLRCVPDTTIQLTSSTKPLLGARRVQGTDRISPGVAFPSSKVRGIHGNKAASADD